MAAVPYPSYGARSAVEGILPRRNGQTKKHTADHLITPTCTNRILLNKGYTENGFAERVFHIHLRLKGDVDEIYFKDYLNAHPDVAEEYEKLKLSLWKKYEHNRDAYTDAKTEFVKKYTRLAKQNNTR